MKSLTLTLLFFIASNSTFSNFVYSGHLLHQRWAPKDFTERLKEMELIFFLKPEEKHLKEEYEEIFSENWSLCKYRIVEDSGTLLEEVKNNPGEKKCFLSVIGYKSIGINIMTSPYEYYKDSHHYLCLWRPDYTRKGELEINEYTYKVAIPLIFNQKKHAKLDIDDDFDRRNGAQWFRYQNWAPSYIGLYLRMMEISIERDARDIFYTPQSSSKFDHKKAKALWKGELLIPEYTFDNRLRGTIKHYDNLDKPETIENKALFSLYKWNYRVMNANEMTQALQEKKENTFYLFFQRGGISVINIKTGDIIVHIVFTPKQLLEYKLNENKMENFVKTIEKLKYTNKVYLSGGRP